MSHKIRRKNTFEPLIDHLFDELHCSTIVHMNQMKHEFQDLSFYSNKEVPENSNEGENTLRLS